MRDVEIPRRRIVKIGGGMGAAASCEHKKNCIYDTFINNINQMDTIKTLLETKNKILFCDNFNVSEKKALLKILTKRYDDCCRDELNEDFMKLYDMINPNTGRSDYINNDWLPTPRCSGKGND